MWWRKDGVQPASRPVFEATRVSRSVCLFQLKILQLVEEEESKGALPTAVASRLDAFQKVTHTHMHTHTHTRIEKEIAREMHRRGACASSL